MLGNASRDEAGRCLQSFEDLHTVSQHFADELGRLKEQNQTVSPADTRGQADAENTYPVSTLADPGKKLDAETYLRPGQAGRRGRRRNLQVHEVQALARPMRQRIRGPPRRTDPDESARGGGLQEAGGDGGHDRRRPSVSRQGRARFQPAQRPGLAQGRCPALRPLPVSDDVSVGATVYCLSHPVLPSGKTNCFYTFSQGIVCGKFTFHADESNR